MPRKHFLLLLLPLLAACGSQVSFKQGGDAGSFSIANGECRKQKEYEQCMKDKGWSVHKMSEFNFNPLTVPVLTDNRTPGIPDPPAAASTSTKTTAAPAASAAATKDTKNTPPVAPADPLSKYNVAAWSKWGGTADGLKADTEACVNKLGPAHKPAPDSPMMTLGLIWCLKDKDWQGLQGY